MRILILCLTLCACSNGDDSLNNHTLYRCKNGIIMQKGANDLTWSPQEVGSAAVGPNYVTCSPDGPL